MSEFLRGIIIRDEYAAIVILMSVITIFWLFIANVNAEIKIRRLKQELKAARDNHRQFMMNVDEFPEWWIERWQRQSAEKRKNEDILEDYEAIPIISPKTQEDILKWSEIKLYPYENEIDEETQFVKTVWRQVEDEISRNK